MASINAQGIIYTCLTLTGSTWVSKDDLECYCKKKNISIERVITDKNVINYKHYYTTRSVAQAENDIAINVMSLLHCSPVKRTKEKIIENIVHQFEEEKNEGRKLHYRQIDAVKMVVNNSFSVLTGGPGTGKTTVLTAIAYTLRQLKKDIQIAYTAPTGKAARRITESTGEMATTLNKKLGLGHKADNSSSVINIEEDVLFIDESSMTDNALAACLFKAIKGGMRVVFVGDVNQLPSVGIGAVLRDLIASEVVPVTMLTHTFRQDNTSVLFENINKCKHGDANLVEGKDFKPIKLNNSSDIENDAIRKILEAYVEDVKKYGIENVVVLMPYRRTGVCSNVLNKKMQRVVNKKDVGYQYTDKDENTMYFCKDDFVMQLENREECANGDVGKVIHVSEKGVDVQYVDGIVHYNGDELYQITLAYAMSIHKSQGSEYASVIMCVLKSHKKMLQRNLVYTGITRAKKKCTIIYEQEALEKALNTIAEESRKTFLAEKLKALAMKYQIAS